MPEDSMSIVRSAGFSRNAYQLNGDFFYWQPDFSEFFGF